MKLEQQVCSLELAKQLKQLGVKQESLFYWKNGGRLGYHVVPTNGELFTDIKRGYAAFTVAELGEMLPKIEHIVTMFFENGHCQIAIQGDIQLEIDNKTLSRWGAASQCIEAATEADARAKMLIYLIENQLVTFPPAQR